MIGIASSPLNHAKAEADQKSAKPAKVLGAVLLDAAHATAHCRCHTPQARFTMNTWSSSRVGTGVSVNLLPFLHMQPKWVAFAGGSSAKVDAPGSGGSGKALTDYLALPVSQYSLLDEKLVER